MLRFLGLLLGMLSIAAVLLSRLDLMQVESALPVRSVRPVAADASVSPESPGHTHDGQTQEGTQAITGPADPRDTEPEVGDMLRDRIALISHAVPEDLPEETNVDAPSHAQATGIEPVLPVSDDAIQVAAPPALAMEGPDELTGTAPAAWHVFWTPFASERSAQGFATRIEGLTGVVTRVMEQPEGGYVVGFDYRDVDERRVYLHLIEAATGLDLGAARP